VVAPAQGSAGGGAVVEGVRERKFLAGPEGSTKVGVLIVNIKINSINHDEGKRRKEVADRLRKINSRKIPGPSDNWSK
jgi:hypothetical protein